MSHRWEEVCDADEDWEQDLWMLSALISGRLREINKSTHMCPIPRFFLVHSQLVPALVTMPALQSRCEKHTDNRCGEPRDEATAVNTW